MSSSGVTRVDLRPDRDLLDPHFESYKLSLESPPVFRTSLSSASSDNLTSLSSLQPDDAQYSYLHAKLFSNTSNLLVADSHDTERVFLLDPSSAGSVWQAVLSRSGPPVLVKVFEPPNSSSSKKSGDYNPSLCFAGPDFAVIADGREKMYVVSTGDRSSSPSQQWEVVFSSGEGIFGRGQPFMVASATVADAGAGEKTELHCLVNYVEEKEKVENLKADKSAANFVNVVEWMCLARSGNCWGLDRLRRFAMFGSVDYLQLEKGGETFYVATEKPFAKVFDSAGGDSEEEESVVEKSSTSDEKPPFYWYQGVEDMAVWVPLPGGREAGWTKRDIKVSLRPRELTVTLKGEKAFGGQLWNVMDTDSMTWTLQGEKLEITVCKANEGLVWQQLNGKQLSRLGSRYLSEMEALLEPAA